MRYGPMILALALAACSSEPAKQEPADETTEPTVHEMMTEHVDTTADQVWAVGNSAIGDNAGLDPAQMTEAMWQDLATGAGRLSDAAGELAMLETLRVARAGVKIGDEDTPGGHSAAEVQGFIDAQPDNFRAMASTLASHSADLHEAALAHDTARAGALIDGLDPVCESCHLEFWYPSQKALLKELEKTDPTLRGEMDKVMS